jgi:hypothetical protein
MTGIVIVHHSGYGHTHVQAQAVLRGAAGVPGVTAQLLAVEALADAGGEGWSALDAADAIIFGAPTYMAGPSAQFKAFLDATSGRWADQRWKDKLAAGFTNSAGMNGDKLATLQQLALFAMQHGMVWVGLGPSLARWRSRMPTRRPSWRPRAPTATPPSILASVLPRPPSAGATRHEPAPGAPRNGRDRRCAEPLF